MKKAKAVLCVIFMAIAMIVAFRKVAFSLEAKEPIIKMVIFSGWRTNVTCCFWGQVMSLWRYIQWNCGMIMALLHITFPVMDI